MQNTRDALTPENLAMLQSIAETGSFAAAARQLGVVPSALTYRVRQIEDALDVLLFDRSARHARPTDAGMELLREGKRLLEDVDAIANRVRRVATAGSHSSRCRWTASSRPPPCWSWWRRSTPSVHPRA